MNTGELSALITLLDDEDFEVYDQVEKQLLDYGKPVIPFLESAWEHSLDAILQDRIEHIIHKIQFQNVLAETSIWAASAEANAYAGQWKSLLQGAILIARYQYPDLDEDKIHATINRIKRDVWLELNEYHTALEQVKIINHILYNIHNFSGNTTNYHAPQNSFINNVLESKKGNPLLLSIIYSCIAQSLDIPIYGVNLPEHFILTYYENHHNCLFYVNAFSKGMLFQERELDAFLKQLNMPKERMYYEPCNNVYMIQRMARNLMFSYQKLGYTEKVEELESIISAIMQNADK